MNSISTNIDFSKLTMCVDSLWLLSMLYSRWGAGMANTSGDHSVTVLWVGCPSPKAGKESPLWDGMHPSSLSPDCQGGFKWDRAEAGMPLLILINLNLTWEVLWVFKACGAASWLLDPTHVFAESLHGETWSRGSSLLSLDLWQSPADPGSTLWLLLVKNSTLLGEF